MNLIDDTDVLIVGAGPSGLMMACQLAIRNISFRIIDKNEDHTTQSRALVIQARSMEIFDQMGIVKKAHQQGQIVKAIGAFFNGRKIFRVVVNNLGQGLTKFPYLFMLEQSRTEAILIDFLKEYGYEVERNVELKNFTQNKNEVVAVLALPGDREQTIKARYLIGADGAHSIVREKLNIPFSGKTYEQSLFVLDCKAEVDIPQDEMYIAFGTESIGGFFPLTNGRWRILGTIPKEKNEKDTIIFQDIENNFGTRISMKVRIYDPQWIAIYHSHHRYASVFHKGRCFIVGDAAHIHSPIGAQGMNTGLQDAYNLAWKLALVLMRRTKNSLLDTYTQERIVTARNLVRSTDRAFNLVSSESRLLKIFRLYIIPIILRLGLPLFNHLKFLPEMLFKMVSEIGIDYRRSTLSQNASFGKFSCHAPKPGHRLPFISFKGDTYDDEMNIQDRVRSMYFCLLVFKGNVPDEISSTVKNLKDVIKAEIIPLTDQTKAVYKKFGIVHSGCYLIRPDMYIAYRSQGFDGHHFYEYLASFMQL